MKEEIIQPKSEQSVQTGLNLKDIYTIFDVVEPEGIVLTFRYLNIRNIIKGK